MKSKSKRMNKADRLSLKGSGRKKQVRVEISEPGRLPPGWREYIKFTSYTDGRPRKIYTFKSPNGRKLKSLDEVRRHVEAEGSKMPERRAEGYGYLKVYK